MATQADLPLLRLDNFMGKSGFFFIPEKEASNIIYQYRSLGYKIYELPKEMISKDDFFNGIRKILPLDPPLSSNRSWDALNDSLWSGLNSLSENKILIIWPSICGMKKNNNNFAIISEIFEDLPKSLLKEKEKDGVIFNLVIIGIT